MDVTSRSAESVERDSVGNQRLPDKARLAAPLAYSVRRLLQLSEPHPSGSERSRPVHCVPPERRFDSKTGNARLPLLPGFEPRRTAASDFASPARVQTQNSSSEAAPAVRGFDSRPNQR